MTRKEHLDWCKQRALEYVDGGNLQEAFTSFVSDIDKHEETKDILELIQLLGISLLLAGNLDTKEKMREHINGYK